MKIQVIKTTTNELPKYETIDSAGCDLHAELSLVNEKFLFNAEAYFNLDNTIDNIVIHPGGRALIPTGLKMALPVGFEAQVRPRSGLALKYGITVLNTPGTIDADYRGDIGVVLINNGFEPFTVKQGDRIAQLVINEIVQGSFIEVKVLTETDRGDGGFGHTGTM